MNIYIYIYRERERGEGEREREREREKGRVNPILSRSRFQPQHESECNELWIRWATLRGCREGLGLGLGFTLTPFTPLSYMIYIM